MVIRSHPSIDEVLHWQISAHPNIKKDLVPSDKDLVPLDIVNLLAIAFSGCQFLVITISMRSSCLPCISDLRRHLILGVNPSLLSETQSIAFPIG